jgi:hypothetical protein
MGDERMTWFKVDDKLWGHPKWMGLPSGARALWVTAGSYCASNETDGRVPATVLVTLGARRRDAEALVQAGLWTVIQPDANQNAAKLQPNSSQTPAKERAQGAPRETQRAAAAVAYQFHEWDQYQPTKEQVRAERDAAKERQRKWRETRKSRRDNAVTNGVTNGVSNAAPTRPDPTSLSSPLSATSPPTTNRQPPTGGKRDTTPARQLAATLLGITQDDPRLDHLPELFRANNVRAPGPWLRATAEAGDLESLLDIATDNATDPWAHLPRIGPA